MRAVCSEAEVDVEMGQKIRIRKNHYTELMDLGISTFGKFSFGVALAFIFGSIRGQEGIAVESHCSVPVQTFGFEIPLLFLYDASDVQFVESFAMPLVNLARPFKVAQLLTSSAEEAERFALQQEHFRGVEEDGLVIRNCSIYVDTDHR